MKREMVLVARDFKKSKEMHAMKKFQGFWRKCKLVLLASNMNYLKNLHYELWNAEIHKIQLALQRQTLKFFDCVNLLIFSKSRGKNEKNLSDNLFFFCDENFREGWKEFHVGEGLATSRLFGKSPVWVSCAGWNCRAAVGLWVTRALLCSDWSFKIMIILTVWNCWKVLKF